MTVDAIAERARRRVVARLAARLRGDLPDIDLVERDAGLVLRGRKLLRDPRLVWIGSVLR